MRFFARCSFWRAKFSFTGCDETCWWCWLRVAGCMPGCPPGRAGCPSGRCFLISSQELFLARPSLGWSPTTPGSASPDRLLVSSCLVGWSCAWRSPQRSRSYNRHGDQTGTNRNGEETAWSNGMGGRVELDWLAGHRIPVRENWLSWNQFHTVLQLKRN